MLQVGAEIALSPEEQQQQVDALTVLKEEVHAVVGKQRDPLYFQHISIQVCVCGKVGDWGGGG